MRSFFMWLVFLCTLTAAAQDVIVKKDGSTIVCRVVELGKTEVVYKRWSNLQGDNYVMNLTDITSINYENGEKKTFNAPVVTENANTNVPSTINTTPQYIDDGALLALAEKAEMGDKKVDVFTINKKAKRLKRAGWICGIIMVGVGVPLLAICKDGEDSYYDGSESWIYPEFLAPGLILTAGGIALTTGCLVKSHNLKKRYLDRVYSTAVWENDFKFKNNSSLSTQICSIRDSRQLAPTLGIGLNYQF